MPEPGAPALICQLRVVVRGISPLIWRRLLVPADATIAGQGTGPEYARCYKAVRELQLIRSPAAPQFRFGHLA